MQLLSHLRNELKRKANPERAKILRRFFKTEKGEYGEGVVFYGITVPETRKIATHFRGLSLSNVKILLSSKIHEERLAALLLLVHKFQKGTKEEKKKVFDFYLQRIKKINNWDLVDLSADKIVGEYLKGKSPTILFRLAKSKNIWERRIAMMATFQFIKAGEFSVALEIAKRLLLDTHDLIQKAVGWMLREIGKRSLTTEEKFLRTYSGKISRTTLRYAVERFPERKRLRYLRGAK